MKRAVALGLVLIAGVAMAAAYAGTFSINSSLPAYLRGGLFVGANRAADTLDRITTSDGASATIDFASTSVGTVLSSAITATGAAVGDVCEVGTPAAAAALLAQFECQVTAADTVKVKFTPKSESAGTCTLGGESPSVCPAQTVIAGSVCKCSPVGTSAAIAAAGCAVSLSGTTLTITSLNGGTHVVNYWCTAPVDPASGTYRVRTFGNQ